MRFTNINNFDELKEAVDILNYTLHSKEPIQVSANVLKIIVDKISELEEGMRHATDPRHHSSR